MSASPILLFRTGGDGEPPRDRWYDVPLVLLFTVVAVAILLGLAWGVVTLLGAAWEVLA